MAGHSKWANTKHRKERQDAKRGKLFANLIRAVEAAARQGGTDPEGNATLYNAIEKAKDASVPKENIERAIARGGGDVDGVDYEEVWYEGYAAGGVALYVQVLTDNRNRAAAAVRSTFTRMGGSLGEPGSVSYLFAPKGIIVASGDEEAVMLAALDGGAEDVTGSAEQWEIVCPPGDLAAVRASLVAAGIVVERAEVTQLPSTSVVLDEPNARRVLRLVDALEDLDDVQEVFANFDIPEEILESVG